MRIWWFNRLRSQLLTLLIGAAAMPALADVTYLELFDRQQQWSLGAVYRTGESPYRGDRRSEDFLPVITYSGERLFLYGTKAGVHLIDNPDWTLDLFAAVRFDGYNEADSAQLVGMADRHRSLDGGLQLAYRSRFGSWVVSAQGDMLDNHQGSELKFRWGYPFETGRWHLTPWLGWNRMEGQLASYYFGVRAAEAQPGRAAYRIEHALNAQLGLDLRYRVSQHSFVSLNLAATGYDDRIANSPIVGNDHVYQMALTYRYEFNDDLFDSSSPWLADGLKRRPRFMRVAGGCYTSTALNQIVRGSVNCHPADTSLTSLFVGQQLTDQFFDYPWQIWVKGGIARHHEQDFQSDFNEYVLAIKAYYAGFPWSDKVETRFGFAEGMSYAEQIPHFERLSVEGKNRSASRLLNYLDVSLDVSLNDIFKVDSKQRCYAGFSVHHRSGIFATSLLFGQVNGGSNFNTLYLECLV